MIELRIRPSSSLGSARAAYRVAGTTLLADEPLSALAAFAVTPHRRTQVPAPHARRHRRLSDPPLFCGPAWIGEAQREVTCHRTTAGFELAVENAGVFTVTSDGAAITSEEAHPLTDETGAWIESLLGPTLILALALRGTWCLHASALSRHGKLIAFAGDSGCGKSTLAALLHGSEGQRRLADDVLPVRMSPEGPVALPAFPQLKLATGDQPGARAAERIPLAGLYEVSLMPTGDTHTQDLRMRDAACAVARHTIAARLFAPELLERHLAFCAAFAQHVSVARLTVARGAACPRQVARILYGPTGSERQATTRSKAE